MKQCRRYVVSGRVQGVWYRASTQEKARSLAINGYARNLANGQVEVMACGAEEQLDKLEAWLWRGPLNAHVESVEWNELAWRDTPGFTTA